MIYLGITNFSFPCQNPKPQSHHQRPTPSAHHPPYARPPHHDIESHETLFDTPHASISPPAATIRAPRTRIFRARQPHSSPRPYLALTGISTRDQRSERQASMALERFVLNTVPLRAQSSAVRGARGRRGCWCRCAGGVCSSEIVAWRGIMRSGVDWRWVCMYVCSVQFLMSLSLPVV
jgi:hypothetical protein